MVGPEALISGRIRAHDTRSVSSSWALFNGASLKDFQQAVYWSSPNSFISCYLKDVLVGEASFASAVFKTLSSGSRETFACQVRAQSCTLMIIPLTHYDNFATHFFQVG